MLASDLLGRAVVDRTGRDVGMVHDVRVRLPDTVGDRPVVLHLVVGPSTLRCRLSHAWGYAQDTDHGRGPSLVRLLVGTGAGARTVPASAVAAWDDHGRVRLEEGTP